MPKRKNSKKRANRNGFKAFFLKIVLSSFFIAAILAVGFNFIRQNAAPCANSISCIKDLSGVYQPQKASIFMGRAVTLPKYVADDMAFQRVLGETSAPKHIYVDLSKQRLYAYEGDYKVMDFPISSGKWYPTPTGEFKIWTKLRFAHMEGGNPNDGTYYNLYNIPYTMFFYGDNASQGRGFSLHGAYWHNNFGYPMSHGCVNIRPEDAAKLYYWTDPVTEGDVTTATDKNPGTLVTIYGQPPV